MIFLNKYLILILDSKITTKFCQFSESKLDLLNRNISCHEIEKFHNILIQIILILTKKAWESLIEMFRIHMDEFFLNLIIIHQIS